MFGLSAAKLSNRRHALRFLPVSGGPVGWGCGMTRRWFAYPTEEGRFRVSSGVFRTGSTMSTYGFSHWRDAFAMALVYAGLSNKGLPILPGRLSR